MNSTPKYVASTTLQGVEWQNSTLIKGDVGEEVAKLKAAIARTENAIERAFLQRNLQALTQA